MIPRDRFAAAAKIATEDHRKRRLAGRGWCRKVAGASSVFHLHAPSEGALVRRSGNDLDPIRTECGRTLRGALVSERASNPRPKCRRCAARLSRAEGGARGE